MYVQVNALLLGSVYVATYCRLKPIVLCTCISMYMDKETRCLRSLHAMLAVTAGDREG